MLDPQAQAFLMATRLGFLSHRVDPSGWSRPVPVWFDGTDEAVRLFSAASSPKVARLRQDPRAHLLVANHVGEPEAWVSLTADVDIGSVDASWLEGLCARYWDLSDPDRRTAVDRYLADLDALVLLELRPTRVRSHFF
jgi:general stress protein 26